MYGIVPPQRCLSCPEQTEGRDENIGSDVHQPMCSFNSPHLRILGYLRISGFLGISGIYQNIGISENIRISQNIICPSPNVFLQLSSPHNVSFTAQMKYTVNIKTLLVPTVWFERLINDHVQRKELFFYKGTSLFVTLMVSFCLSKNYVKRGQTDASDAHSLFIQLKTMSTNKSGSPQDNSPNLGIEFMTQ